MTLTFVKPNQQPWINVLLYGSPKSGKSTGACSAPGGVLLINADLPNAARFAHSRDTLGRIMEVQFEGMQTLIDVGHAVQNESGTRVIDTVVVDPIGELHRRLLEEASNRAVRPTLNQYGDVGTQLERFCRMLCEAPVNVVLVCHERATKDEALQMIERVPFTGTTNPALGEKLMGMVDIIGYTGVLETEDPETHQTTKQYVAGLVNDRGRRGGDRFDVLGDWQPLDLTRWFELAGASKKDTPTIEPSAEQQSVLAA